MSRWDRWGTPVVVGEAVVLICLLVTACGPATTVKDAPAPTLPTGSNGRMVHP